MIIRYKLLEKLQNKTLVCRIFNKFTYKNTFNFKKTRNMNMIKRGLITYFIIELILKRIK